MLFLKTGVQLLYTAASISAVQKSKLANMYIDNFDTFSNCLFQSTLYLYLQVIFLNLFFFFFFLRSNLSRQRKKEGEPANDYWVCNFVHSTCNGCQTTLVGNESIIQKGLQQISFQRTAATGCKGGSLWVAPEDVSEKFRSVFTWLLCVSHSTNVL